MAIQNTTFRVYVEKLGASQATSFIGNEGDLFYDPNDAELRLSDGTTPGGVIVTSSSVNPSTGVGTGIILGTLDQIDVLGIGSDGYQVSISDQVVLPGSFQVSGISTLAADGSDSFTGGDLTVGGKVRSIRYSTVSDERLKRNIKKINRPLEVLAGIKGVLFNWREDNSQDVGLIAQDVERALPEAVHEIDNIKSVNYNGVIGLLVEAVKELSEENQLLRMDVASMKEKI